MHVRDALYDLFSKYVEVSNARSQKSVDGEKCTSTCPNSTSREKLVSSGLSMFDEYLNVVEVDAPLKSVLDIYLEEGVYRSQSMASDFDVLSWWKSQE